MKRALLSEAGQRRRDWENATRREANRQAREMGYPKANAAHVTHVRVATWIANLHETAEQFNRREITREDIKCYWDARRGKPTSEPPQSKPSPATAVCGCFALLLALAAIGMVVDVFVAMLGR